MEFLGALGDFETFGDKFPTGSRGIWKLVSLSTNEDIWMSLDAREDLGEVGGLCSSGILYLLEALWALVAMRACCDVILLEYGPVQDNCGLAAGFPILTSSLLAIRLYSF